MPPNPPQDSTIDDQFGFIDWTNKIVLDLYTQEGQTSFYFVEKGAKIIYAFEMGEFNTTRPIIKASPYSSKIFLRWCNFLNKHEMIKLLIEIKPTIVKCDWRYNWEVLRTIEKQYFGLSPEYIFKLRAQGQVNNLETILTKQGYHIDTRKDLSDCIMIYAKQDSNWSPIENP